MLISGCEFRKDVFLQFHLRRCYYHRNKSNGHDKHNLVRLKKTKIRMLQSAQNIDEEKSELLSLEGEINADISNQLMPHSY